MKASPDIGESYCISQRSRWCSPSMPRFIQIKPLVQIIFVSWCQRVHSSQSFFRKYNTAGIPLLNIDGSTTVEGNTDTARIVIHDEQENYPLGSRRRRPIKMHLQAPICGVLSLPCVQRTRTRKPILHQVIVCMHYFTDSTWGGFGIRF